jgi:hypothetical protein
MNAEFGNLIVGTMVGKEIFGVHAYTPQLHEWILVYLLSHYLQEWLKVYCCNNMSGHS